MEDETIRTTLDEQIVYDQLNGNEQAVWSLLLASGYLKVLSYEEYDKVLPGMQPKYEIALTNLEVKLMFRNMIRMWFSEAETDYNDFVKALLIGDVRAMNVYMNRVALSTFSYFDTGKRPFGDEPERFYHGFVLGLIVELQVRYVITSNRESGFGRYDVVLEPRNRKKTMRSFWNLKCRIQTMKNHYRIQFREHYCRLKKRSTRRYFWKKEFRKIISENMDLHSAVRMY